MIPTIIILLISGCLVMGWLASINMEVYNQTQEDQGRRPEQIKTSQKIAFFCLVFFILTVLVAFIIEKLIQHFN